MKPATVLTLLTLVPSALAQTGPWTDGELILRNGSGVPTINRVVPETGETAVLIAPQAFGGFSGAMVFDSFRGGLLANLALAPETTVYRLWLVAHDGTAEAIPGFTGGVKALASAGDGRVFFIRYTGATQGPTPVEYVAADDKIQTLLAADGVTPFELDAEHLLYHAPSNALIGSSSAQWAATHCGPTGSSIYRVPLSADGLRVDGAMTCTSIPTTLLTGDVMALDHLPGGNVLVTTATAFLGAPHPMISVDPVTLALGIWAQPAQHDINGGVWSARLGKAVIHANSGAAWWEPDGLRALEAGQDGYGTFLATSLPLPVGGGFSPIEILIDVDLNGPGCDGIQLAYGSGLAGTGGFVPQLGAFGCPDVGSTFTLSIADVVGGAPGVIFVGLSSGAQPFKGGTFLIGSFALIQPCIAVGTPGAPGAGDMTFPVTFTDPILIGVDIFLQAAYADDGAVKNVSMTNGLRIQAG